ncbi:TonB-dependent receptor [Desulfobulbus sp.]|uniref:TonB-dependent receptor n=1 Tax=Desulfobulbus sp. TaxID=895 RepID=UPI00286F34AF|nr:TonB-dependent receptor [Desulfobulbus sp.]
MKATPGRKTTDTLILGLMIGTVSWAPQPAAADEQPQDATHVLEEMVVTSTTKSTLIDTPASISVVTAADLEQMGAKNITEALERIPGVYNTTASNSSVSIRGTRSSMAGGPVILIDGVAQNYGNYRREELDVIPVSQIERIEVLRSAGIAYGPGAARGVISIITKKNHGDKPVNGHISSSYGSWDTTNVSGGVNGRLDRWDYLADLSYYRTDGYEEERSERSAGLLKLGYNLSDRTRIGIRGDWVSLDSDTAYDLAKYQWQLDNYRRDIHFPKAENDPRLVWHNTKEQDSGIYAIDFSHNGPKLFVDGTLAYTHYNEVYFDNQDIYTSTSRARGDRDDRIQDTYTATLSGGYRMDFGALHYTPSVGVSVEDVDFTQRKAYPFDPLVAVASNKTAKAKADVDLAETTSGIFWDNDLLLNERWGLKIGSRLDRVDMTFQTKEPSRLDIEEDMWSWQVAPSYHFTPDANVYFSVARNYWFPTPQYYYWAASYGSPNNRPEDLKPEESLTYEIGYKHHVNNALNIALTTYFMDTKDKFGGYYEGGNYMGMKNIGDAETYGVELELDGRPLNWLGYRISGAWIDAEWTSGTARIYRHPTNTRVDADLNGYKVNNIPEFTSRIGVDFYPREGWKASLDAISSSKYYLDYTNRLAYPSTTTFDASVSYSWDKYKVWILAKNIFDEDVERAINSDGELARAYGPANTAYYVLDGLYVEAGISVKF